MKPSCQSVALIFALLGSFSTAHAQSPRDELAQMVVQLQATPADSVLRERIIKLAMDIKPAPAIPEDARRSFVEGVTIVKSGRDTSAQKLAIESFNEALKIAPWWGDAYYNLAAAQELAGQLGNAERALKWFMLSNPSEGDARDAQDRVYVIAAKRKLAAAEATARQEESAARSKRNKLLCIYAPPFDLEMSVFIDPDRQTVVNSLKGSTANGEKTYGPFVASVSDTVIRWTERRNDWEHRYAIDRVTGAMKHEQFYQGRPHAELLGQCRPATQ